MSTLILFDGKSIDPDSSFSGIPEFFDRSLLYDRLDLKLKLKPQKPLERYWTIRNEVDKTIADGFGVRSFWKRTFNLRKFYSLDDIELVLFKLGIDGILDPLNLVNDRLCMKRNLTNKYYHFDNNLDGNNETIYKIGFYKEPSHIFDDDGDFDDN